MRGMRSSAGRTTAAAPTRRYPYGLRSCLRSVSAPSWTGIPDCRKENVRRAGFLIRGNMASQGQRGNLIVRAGPDATKQPWLQPNTRPFDMTGRPMNGWIIVTPAGPGPMSTPALGGAGGEVAETLPPK